MGVCMCIMHVCNHEINGTIACVGKRESVRPVMCIVHATERSPLAAMREDLPKSAVEL
jgi:hypothetical protein